MFEEHDLEMGGRMQHESSELSGRHPRPEQWDI